MSKSDSVGWGRMAVSRFAKSEEEIKADILKAIEGKLSAEFQDYSQWQRQTVLESSSPHPSSRTSVKAKTTTRATSSRPLTYNSGATQCSSLCLHLWKKKATAPDTTADIIKNRNIMLLQAQIKAKRDSVKAYKAMKENIAELNRELKNEICQDDLSTHQNVTQLLQKYEKCSAASKMMTKQHLIELDVAEKEFEASKVTASENLKELSMEVSELDNQLQSLLIDLQVLRTYKDKEYPVKAMSISKLQNKVQNLTHEHKGELGELKRIVQGEEHQMLANRNHRTFAILQDASDHAYHNSSGNLLEKVARNNSILRHEIVENIKEIAETEREIATLQFDLDSLRKLKETDVRKFVFPEIHGPLQKCHPDEEIVLDIPKQELLPI